MSLYYNMDGEPIGRDEMVKLYEGDQSARILGRDKIGEYTISTVLLGIDHSFGEGPPLIFETMIFGGDDDSDEKQWRYSTRAEAEEGHRQACSLVQSWL